MRREAVLLSFLWNRVVPIETLDIVVAGETGAGEFLVGPEDARVTGAESAKPRICHVLHGLGVGGAEVLAARLARRLRDRYRFVFVCLDELGTLGGQLRAEGFPVHVVGRRAGVDVRCMRRLTRLLREERVDIVHAHQYTPFFYTLAARLFYRHAPVVFTEHGRFHPDYPRPKRILANRLLLERRDRVVAVGETVRQALVHNEGIAAERIDVIYNGIDLQTLGGWDGVCDAPATSAQPLPTSFNRKPQACALSLQAEAADALACGLRINEGANGSRVLHPRLRGLNPSHPEPARPHSRTVYTCRD